jgi:hypothetical protein
LALVSGKTMSAQLNAHHQDAEISRVIAEKAYYKAEIRGFEPGFEEQDWIESENDIVAIADAYLWPY